jgi:WD40 repeat protein
VAGNEKTGASRVRRWIVASVAACLLMALGTGIRYWTTRSEQAPVVQEPVGKARLAPLVVEVEQVDGEVLIVNQERKTLAHQGQFLLPGHGIMTRGTASEAIIRLDDDTRMKVGGDTVVFTSFQGDEDARMVVEQRSLVVDVGRHFRRRIKVQTSLGVAVTEAESSLHIIDGTGLAVVRGLVRFTHRVGGKSILIKEGHYLVATREGELSVGRWFSGGGNDWVVFPKAGLDIRRVAFKLAFSPDGKWLAAADHTTEKGIRHGVLEDGAAPIELEGRFCVAFSRDGKTLAAGGRGRVLLHDLPTGKPPRVLADKSFRGRVQSLAFSLDGKTLAAGQDSGEVVLWDLATETIRGTLSAHDEVVTSLAYSPDGQYVASASLDGTVVLWDAASAQEKARIERVTDLAVWAVAFSPDSATLAIATGPCDFRLRSPEGEVWLWDVGTQKKRQTLHGHLRAVTSLAYSPDGRTLVTGSADATVRFWDAATGEEYAMLKGHKIAEGFDGLTVAVSPDGKYLATGSADRTVKLWKLTSSKNDARVGPQVVIQPKANSDWFACNAHLLYEPPMCPKGGCEFAILRLVDHRPEKGHGLSKVTMQ